MNDTNFAQKIALWLKTFRQNQNLNIQEFSESTGVPISKISRIENGKKKITLLALVTLCFDIGVSPIEFLEQIELEVLTEGFKNYASHQRKDVNILTIEDVLAFTLFYRQEFSVASQYFINLLSSALSKENSKFTEQQARYEAIKIIFGDQTINAEKYIQKRIRVDLLNISYPNKIDNSILLENFMLSGAIIINDAGSFARNLRFQIGNTIRKQAELANISSSMLSRIENGLVERIRFNDLIALDKSLNANGLCFAIFWVAAEFHTGVRQSINIPGDEVTFHKWDEDNFAIATNLIKTVRRRQALSIEDWQWLNEFRSTYKFYYINDVINSTEDQVTPQKSSALSSIYVDILLNIMLSKQRPESLDANLIDYPDPAYQQSWNILWNRLLSKNDVAKSVFEDLLENRHDYDYHVAFKAQLKKAFLDDPGLYKEIVSSLKLNA